MRHRWLLIFALCHAAHATTPDCLLYLATLSESDPNRLTLTGVTYDRLLDSLGGQLTKATLRKMIDGQDPFGLPAQPGADLFILQTKLHEMKKLLTDNRLHAPETIRHLLARLALRIEGVDEQAAKETAAIQATWKNQVFQGKSDRPTTAVSPDGRWLVMLPYLTEDTMGGTLVPLKVRIIDLHTGTTREVSNPHHHHYNGRLGFGPDGKSLLFVIDRRYLLTVPFENGVPDWDAANLKQYPFPREGITPARPGENANFAFADRPVPINRINLTTKKEDTVALTNEVTQDGFYSSVRRVGSAGSSDKIFAVLESPAYDGRIVVYDMPDGKPTGHNVVAQWNKKEPFHGLGWSKEGKPITVNGNKFYEWNSSTEPREIMQTTGVPPWNPKLQNPTRWDVKAHAAGAVVLYADGAEKRWVEVFDFEQHKHLGTLPLPDDAEVISLSPDGQRLLVKVGETVHVINYWQRLQ